MWFHVLGIVLLLYGCFKLAVGLAGLLMTQAQLVKLTKIPVIGSFITTDVTTAGKAIEVSIVCFALYSIMRGVYLLNIYNHQKFKDVIQSRHMAYILYGGIGAFMVLFYTLVVYSNVDLSSMYITKDNHHMGTYKLIGIGTGLMFLFIFMMMYVWHSQKELWVHPSAMWAILIACLLIIAYFVYVIRDSYDMIKQKQGEILTIIMIPLASV